jgi:hypothetical protein
MGKSDNYKINVETLADKLYLVDRLFPDKKLDVWDSDEGRLYVLNNGSKSDALIVGKNDDLLYFTGIPSRKTKNEENAESIFDLYKKMNYSLNEESRIFPAGLGGVLGVLGSLKLVLYLHQTRNIEIDFTLAGLGGGVLLGAITYFAISNPLYKRMSRINNNRLDQIIAKYNGLRNEQVLDHFSRNLS